MNCIYFSWFFLQVLGKILQIHLLLNRKTSSKFNLTLQAATENTKADVAFSRDCLSICPHHGRFSADCCLSHHRLPVLIHN